MSIAIVTDSTSDLSPQLAEQLNVGVVPLYVHFKGQTLLDGIQICPQDIFLGIKENKNEQLPTTSPPTPEDFKAAFEMALGQAEHVLAIHISSKLSDTTRVAMSAATHFPGRVTVVDSKLTSAPLGLMVKRARVLIDAGAGIDEITRTLILLRDNTTACFAVDSLEYLTKSKRIGGMQAMLGNLLDIKPILGLENGKVATLAKVSGRDNTLKHMQATMQEWKQRFGHVYASYLYTGDASAVEPLREIGAGLGLEEVECHEFGTVVASHIGPGCYGVALEPAKLWDGWKAV